MDILLMIGYVVVGYLVYRMLKFLYVMFRCYVFTRWGFVKDLKHYGEWAVVTGATSGIGKQYALQFAGQGFKVVLMARNEEKLNTLQNEMESQFNVEVKTIVYDFQQTDGYGTIKDALNGLDIGILVNNVGLPGTRHNGQFPKIGDYVTERLLHQINVNIVSDVMMTHIVVQGMMARQRGLIVHIATLGIYNDLPKMGVYASCKVFMVKFFRLLQVEYGDVIDQQLVTPGGVSTNIYRVKASVGIPTAEDYVASAVRTIGLTDFTSGYWVHEIQGALGYLFQNITSRKTNRAIAEAHFKNIERQKKK